MPSYLHPGVYVEEIPSGAKPIEGVATSTAAFLGYVTKGPPGPELILKPDDYVRLYGGIRDTRKTNDPPVDYMGYSVMAFFQNGGQMAYVVRLANGSPGASEGFLRHPMDDHDHELIRFQAINPGTWGDQIRVTFSNEQGSSDRFRVEVKEKVRDGGKESREEFRGLSLDGADPDFIELRINGRSQWVGAEVKDVTPYMLGTSTSYDLSGLKIPELNGTAMTVWVDGTKRAVEFAASGEEGAFDQASKLDEVADVIQSKVRGTSPQEAVNGFTAESIKKDTQKLLVLTSGSNTSGSSVVVGGPEEYSAAALLRLGAETEGVERTGKQSLDAIFKVVAGDKGKVVTLGGGDNGSEPAKQAFADAFELLTKYRDVRIICLPGQQYDKTTNGADIIDLAIGHAETMKDRVVLVDPIRDTELTTVAGVQHMQLKPSTYGVLYYPWTRVVNPHYDEEQRPDRERTLLVPPCGFVAGIWSKIDNLRGVWKAPAGVETALLGVAGLRYQVEDGEQDQLNPLGVNCLRSLPGYGAVIWGARTLATKTKPEWRYIPVRRTAILIEQSIYEGIQWAVFEPNDHPLWSSLRTNIESFMNGLFRGGAFQGRKASDAYFVRCGLGDTMTQGDIDRGQVIIVVGFAPLKPAEFVILRIQQKVGPQ